MVICTACVMPGWQLFLPGSHDDVWSQQVISACVHGESQDRRAPGAHPKGTAAHPSTCIWARVRSRGAKRPEVRLNVISRPQEAAGAHCRAYWAPFFPCNSSFFLPLQCGVGGCCPGFTLFWMLQRQCAKARDLQRRDKREPSLINAKKNIRTTHPHRHAKSPTEPGKCTLVQTFEGEPTHPAYNTHTPKTLNISLPSRICRALPSPVPTHTIKGWRTLY